MTGFTLVGWRESVLLLLAAGLLLGSGLRRFRSWRPLFWGASALMLITAIFPRRGNPLGQYLFVGPHGAMRVPAEIFGIAWWLLGAWLVKSLFDLVLRRTIFPDDNVPHARRLFADLASGLIYVVAFVGIMDTVFKQPLSGVLATSGVLAIILGLALRVRSRCLLASHQHRTAVLRGRLDHRVRHHRGPGHGDRLARYPHSQG